MYWMLEDASEDDSAFLEAGEPGGTTSPGAPEVLEDTSAGPQFACSRPIRPSRRKYSRLGDFP